MKTLKKSILPIIISIFMVSAAACGKNDKGEGTAEQAGKQLDKAAEQVGQEAGKLLDQAGQAMKDAGEAIKKKTEN